MVEKDSRDVILEFLVRHPIPLKTKGVYGGLIALQDITFSYAHVQDVLLEFREQGYVQRVEIDERAGKLVEIPPDETNRRAYYIVTEKGKRSTKQ